MKTILLTTLLLLSSTAFAALTPEDYIKKQCRSVHIHHGEIPEGTQAIYIEATPEHSSPGTYFSVANFSNGYIGFQELANGVRIVIFSIWDPVAHGDNPNAAPEHERTHVLRNDEQATVSRFGGEGTGGKSMMLFNWQIGEPLKFIVKKTLAPDPNFQILSGYVYDAERKSWRLISSWITHNQKGNLDGFCSFVEDFKRDYNSTQFVRSAVFGPAFTYGKDGKWVPTTKGTFTADSTTPSENVSADMIPEKQAFRISTGGNTTMNDFKLWGSRTLPAEAIKIKAPDQAARDVVEKTPETGKRSS